MNNEHEGHLQSAVSMFSTALLWLWS